MKEIGNLKVESANSPLTRKKEIAGEIRKLGGKVE
jgi:hypothetical protein